MIKNIENKVKQVMLENPCTRDDDWVLISTIYQKFYNVGALSFYDTMRLHEDLNLPSFESITRCRRKLQEKYPTEFRSSEKVAAERHDQECTMYDYSKGRI